MVAFFVEGKMQKYLFMVAAVVALAAYFFGIQIGRMRCVALNARTQSDEIVNIISIKRKTDEKVYNTGLHDIRNILREKYTIAE